MLTQLAAMAVLSLPHHPNGQALLDSMFQKVRTAQSVGFDVDRYPHDREGPAKVAVMKGGYYRSDEYGLDRNGKAQPGTESLRTPELNFLIWHSIKCYRVLLGQPIARENSRYFRWPGFEGFKPQGKPFVAASDPVPTTFHGRRALKVDVTRSPNHPFAKLMPKAWMLIDPATILPIGFVWSAKDFRAEYVYRNVRLNTLVASDFRWRPPLDYEREVKDSG